MEPIPRGAGRDVHPRRTLSEAQHQYYWVSVPGNVNHIASGDPKSKMRRDSPEAVIDAIELKRYVLEDKYKSRNEQLNQMNDELITKYNWIADCRCNALRTRADTSHNPARLAELLDVCRKKVNECRGLRRRIRNQGGRAVPIPDHFLSDPY